MICRILCFLVFFSHSGKLYQKSQSSSLYFKNYFRK